MTVPNPGAPAGQLEGNLLIYTCDVTVHRTKTGAAGTTIDVPANVFEGVLEGTRPPSIPLRPAFDEAWNHPIGMGDPAEVFAPGDRVVVVITDHTRPTPTRDVFPLLWEKVRERVAAEDVTLLVATGSHRAPTEQELESMLGDLRHEFRVLVHDCDRDSVEIGATALGTPIVLHRAVVEADRIVTIGHIGMHYYAGYSGGRKNVLPGVAGRATIEANHARLTDPRSTACVYEGNPINDEKVYDTKSLALRAGFAFDVTGNANTVVKGHFGRYYEGAMNWAYWDTLPGQEDFVLHYYDPEGTDLVGPLGNTFTEYYRSPADPYDMDPDIKHPYVDEITLGFERALGNDLRLSVTGIWRQDGNLQGSVIPTVGGSFRNAV